MPRLSVIMIVRDESHCVADCLSSVVPIADEILIADTGSTDDTRAIAERFGARVFSIDWNDDFAEARNATIAEATGDWLLHMDADEMLAPEGAGRLRQLVDNDGAGADAIEITLANYCDEPRAWRWQPVAADDPWARGHSGYLAVPLLRLFRRGNGFEYREPVHENITESVMENGGVIGSSDIVIHHYGYGVAGARGAQKRERYLDIARKKAIRHPTDPKALHDLAEQALACGHLDEAEQACRQLLGEHPDHMPASTTLANICLLRGQLGAARKILESLAAQGNVLPHVHTALGSIDLHQGNWPTAENHFRAALALDDRQVMPRLYLARLSDLRGDAQLARQELEQARRAAPALNEIALRLQALQERQRGEQAYAAGRMEESLKLLVAAMRLDVEDPLVHNDLGVVLHAMGKQPMAIESFKRSMSLMPCLEPPRENLRALEEGGA